MPPMYPCLWHEAIPRMVLWWSTWQISSCYALLSLLWWLPRRISSFLGFTESIPMAGIVSHMFAGAVGSCRVVYLLVCSLHICIHYLHLCLTQELVVNLAYMRIGLLMLEAKVGITDHVVRTLVLQSFEKLNAQSLGHSEVSCYLSFEDAERCLMHTYTYYIFSIT